MALYKKLKNQEMANERRRRGSKEVDRRHY